jgi:hypothetical protein
MDLVADDHVRVIFKIDCCSADKCPGCRRPALPHVLLNCGHALCARCAGRSCICPSCRALISQRTYDRQATVRICNALRCECSDPEHTRRGCAFVGNLDELKRHVAAGETVLRFHDAFPQLTYAEIEAVVKGKPKHDDDGMVTGLIEARKRKQPGRSCFSSQKELFSLVIGIIAFIGRDIKEDLISSLRR